MTSVNVRVYEGYRGGKEGYERRERMYHINEDDCRVKKATFQKEAAKKYQT